MLETVVKKGIYCTIATVEIVSYLLCKCIGMYSLTYKQSKCQAYKKNSGYIKVSTLLRQGKD